MYRIALHLSQQTIGLAQVYPFFFVIVKQYPLLSVLMPYEP